MLDELRERLLREGVKPTAAGRYVAELADHLDDLSEHVPRDVALRLLGSPEVLAEAMLAQPGVRSWTARAPWATLMLGPMLALTVGCVLSAAALVLVVRIFAADLDYGHAASPGTWPYSVLRVIYAFNEHLMPILVGWATISVALRQRAGIGWLLAGAALTALLGGGLLMVVEFHAHDISFGVGLKYEDPFTTVLGRSFESAVLNLILILAPYAALRMRMRMARSA